jgi:SAM-dependent methyltransferase
LSRNINETAARGFDRAAAEYERGRPGFPAAGVAAIAQALDLGPDSTILDLAAGTGKLTRALKPLGARLIAVEPVAGMREQFTLTTPGVELLDGTAEAIPLADRAVDAVLVAQAFHWFDAPAAAAEIHRVLKPAGGLAVVYNRWDTRTPWVARMQELVHSLRGDTPNRKSPWKPQIEATGLFAPFEYREVPYVMTGDRDTVLARVASISYVSVLDKGKRDELLQQVAAILERAGELDLPYITELWWCRAR